MFVITKEKEEVRNSKAKVTIFLTVGSFTFTE